MKSALESPPEANIVAFVGKEHLMSVTKHLTSMINQPQSYMGYQRPSQTISDEEITAETKNELLKTLALASTVYEQDLGDDKVEIPFKHTEEDVTTLKSIEKDYMGKMCMVDIFEDFSGLEQEMESTDYVPQSKVDQHLQQHAGSDEEEKKKLDEYLKSKQGGGGIAKCYPLSFIQGNFAYYHLHK